ncbi:hypothetical protein [Nocardiopsis chromatogenes]|nr:hypothetical protein [Nocardiopsis chromatogenes]
MSDPYHSARRPKETPPGPEPTATEATPPDQGREAHDNAAE